MYYRIAADLVLTLHLGFIVFVVLGGLLVLRFRWMIFVHVPAAFWGAYVELTGRICPLTIWENRFRLRAGDSGYAGSFIEQYCLPVVYPAGLTRDLQFWLAAVVVTANIVVDAWVLYGWRMRRVTEDSA
jgi:hypothetical protein